MKSRFVFFALIMAITILAACSDDDGGTARGREVTFEVAGSFSGEMSTTFITASGGGTSESINSLPWKKTITYQPSVPSTGISVIGVSGVTGQTLTIKVSVNSKQVSSTPGSADNDGTVAVTAPSYIF